MAKRRTRRLPARSSSKSTMVCPPSGKCGIGCLTWGLLSAVLAALGLWMIVGGVMKQWGVMPMTSIIGWYTGGFILLCMAKCCKKKACGQCK